MSSDGFTVTELAARYGVGRRKVLAWIRAGDLPAINLAANNVCRPRYWISRQNVESFEETRRIRQSIRRQRRLRTSLPKTCAPF